VKNGALCYEPCTEEFEDPRWTSYQPWPCEPQSTPLHYVNMSGFWPSPLSRDTTVHLIAQCSALMLLRKHILGDFTLSLDMLSDIHWLSPPEVCQSFKEVLSTLRSVGDAHSACAVASALGVCLAQASTLQER